MVELPERLVSRSHGQAVEGRDPILLGGALPISFSFCLLRVDANSPA